MGKEKILKVFEELISTIERNSVDNQATITNVKLWAKSWREEMYSNQDQVKNDSINNRLDYDVHG